MRNAPGTRTPRARRGASIAVAVLTLLAVAAMHGPSSAHAVLMPMAGASQAGHAHHVVAVVADGRDQPVRTAAGSMSGHHADCVATLRHDGPPTAPAGAVIVDFEQRPAVNGLPGVLTRPRGPPPPSLERLCISRT